jgi:predicted DNA-binding WGR domain protein
MRRFELVEGSSSKFWQVELSGSSFTVTWGRIGTAGQTQEKSFDSDDKA